MDTTIDYILFVRNYDSEVRLRNRRARNKAVFNEVIPKLNHLGLHNTRVDETYGAMFMTDSRETFERTFQVQLTCEQPIGRQAGPTWKALNIPVIPEALSDFISDVLLGSIRIMNL